MILLFFFSLDGFSETNKTEKREKFTILKSI